MGDYPTFDPIGRNCGRPRSLDMRLVINGILYVTVGGIQWRMLPKEFPKWQSVYTYFRNWRNNGIWQRIHDTLRAMVRQRADVTSIRLLGCWTARVSKRRLSVVPGGMTQAKRSMARSVISWSIPLACCWRWLSPQLLSKTAMAPVSCSPILAALARNCTSSGLTVAIAVNSWSGRHNPAAFSFRSYYVQITATDLLSCPGAGWLNVLRLAKSSSPSEQGLWNGFHHRVRPLFTSP